MSHPSNFDRKELFAHIHLWMFAGTDVLFLSRNHHLYVEVVWLRKNSIMIDVLCSGNASGHFVFYFVCMAFAVFSCVLLCSLTLEPLMPVTLLQVPLGNTSFTLPGLLAEFAHALFVNLIQEKNQLESRLVPSICI